MAILGFYNWTNAGTYDNDTNTLIIHGQELAQAYCAERERLWGALDSDKICNAYDVYLPVVVRDYVQP